MKAILLAAGLGTRLRPLTETMPKCLVSINDKPLLEIWLERLSQANVGPFLINTHYLAKQVEEFVGKSKFKDNIKLVNEKLLKGTAGTLIDNIEFYKNEDGMLIHADNYCLADIEEFKKAHQNRPSKCLLTMMIFKTEEPSDCGIVEIDSRGVVIGFHEKVKNPPGNLANGAIYLLSKEFYKYLSDKNIKANDFSLEIISNLMGNIYTYETKEILIDIGTIKNYKKANQ